MAASEQSNHDLVTAALADLRKVEPRRHVFGTRFRQRVEDERSLFADWQRDPDAVAGSVLLTHEEKLVELELDLLAFPEKSICDPVMHAFCSDTGTRLQNLMTCRGPCATCLKEARKSLYELRKTLREASASDAAPTKASDAVTDNPASAAAPTSTPRTPSYPSPEPATPEVPASDPQAASPTAPALEAAPEPPPHVEQISETVVRIRFRGQEQVIQGRDRTWFFMAVVEAGLRGVVFYDLVKSKLAAADLDRRLRIVTTPGAFRKQSNWIKRLLGEKGWQHLWHSTNATARWSPE